MLHGGSWKATYSLVHAGHLCVALRDAGIPTFNVEYRRVGDPGGGWPGSLQDVLLAISHARSISERLVLVGHSAGGHLGLLAAAHLHVPVVGVAAISDPSAWANDAVPLFFGGGAPPREASPLELLPLGVPQVLVHGTRDDVVPFEQSTRYVETSRGEAELVPLDGAGHMEPIDPESPESAVVLGAVEKLLR